MTINLTTLQSWYRNLSQSNPVSIARKPNRKAKHPKQPTQPIKASPNSFRGSTPHHRWRRRRWARRERPSAGRPPQAGPLAAAARPRAAHGRGLRWATRPASGRGHWFGRRGGGGRRRTGQGGRRGTLRTPDRSRGGAQASMALAPGFRVERPQGPYSMGVLASRDGLVIRRVSN